MTCRTNTPQGASHPETDRCGFDRNASLSEDCYVCACGYTDRETPNPRPSSGLSQRVLDAISAGPELLSPLHPEARQFGKKRETAEEFAKRIALLALADGRKTEVELRDRLLRAMNFIEEWSEWWSYALEVDDSKPMGDAECEAGEKMAASLGTRAARMVIENRNFLNTVALSIPSESEPTVSAVLLVKRIGAQRDEIWEAALAVLRHCDAKPEGETDFERAVIALRAACDKVPSYQQRLDNIFKGIADGD